MPSRLLIAGLLFLGLPFLLAAQEIEWSGQVRVRGEVDGRDFRQENALNAYSLLRVRLAAAISPVENIRAFVRIQDARTFGEEPDPGGQANLRNLDLHEGYIEARDFLVEGVTVRAGRMQIGFGNQRILGASDWGNITRSFDGIRMWYQAEETRIDAFFMNVSESSVPPGRVTPSSVAGTRDTGEDLYGVWLATAPMTNSTLNLHVIYQSRGGIQQTLSGVNPDLRRTTAGATGSIRIGTATLEADFGFQAGSEQGRMVSAHLLSGAVEIETWTSGTIRASAEMLSGTPDGSQEVKAFAPPFPSGHRYYGSMDYFVAIRPQTLDGGLLDINATVEGKIGESLWWWLRGHSFSLVQARDAGRELGQEIDLTAGFTYAPPLTFEAGLSVFAPGPVMRDLFGANDLGIWGYISTTMTF